MVTIFIREIRFETQFDEEMGRISEIIDDIRELTFHTSDLSIILSQTCTFP